MSYCNHIPVGPYCKVCGEQILPLSDGFGKLIPMKNNDKAQQLIQNIKSTCQKLAEEMQAKPYTRPGSGQENIFNSFEVLSEIMCAGNHDFIPTDPHWSKCSACGKIRPTRI